MYVPVITSLGGQLDMKTCSQIGQRSRLRSLRAAVSQLCVVWGDFSRPGYNSATLWGPEQTVTFSALIFPSARSEDETEMA